MCDAAVTLRVLCWLLLLALLPTQKIYSGPGTSLDWTELFAIKFSLWNSGSLLLFVLSFAFSAACLRWMSGKAFGFHNLIKINPPQALSWETCCHLTYTLSRFKQHFFDKGLLTAK